MTEESNLLFEFVFGGRVGDISEIHTFSFHDLNPTQLGSEISELSHHSRLPVTDVTPDHVSPPITQHLYIKDHRRRMVSLF